MIRLPLLLSLPLFLCACQNPSGNPKLASRPYPMELHRQNSVPIQVIRTDQYIHIVNSTADDYNNATLWVNQRYSKEIPPLLAGETVRINLWHLYDTFGEKFNAGGVWRTDQPTPLVLAELQASNELPLVGLVVIDQQD
jgi:hypothetical protein